MKHVLLYCLLLLCLAACQKESSIPSFKKPLVATMTYTDHSFSTHTEYTYDDAGRIIQLIRHRSYDDGGKASHKDTYVIFYSGSSAEIYYTGKDTDNTGHIYRQSDTRYTISLNAVGLLESGTYTTHTTDTSGSVPTWHQDFEGRLSSTYDVTGQILDFTDSYEGNYYRDGDAEKTPIRSIQQMKFQWETYGIATRIFSDLTPSSEWIAHSTFVYTIARNTTNINFTGSQDNLFDELGLFGTTSTYIPMAEECILFPDTDIELTTQLKFTFALDEAGRTIRVGQVDEDGVIPAVWEFTYYE